MAIIQGRANDMVQITCYNRTETMRRDKAIKFYTECISMCEGHERQRYAIILTELLCGAMKCSDELA